jgi:hypothetical protein
LGQLSELAPIPVVGVSYELGRVASSRCSKQNTRIKKPRGEAGLKYD